MNNETELIFDCGVLGYYDTDGSFVVVGECGSAADFGIYDCEVINHDGYYTSSGHFIRFSNPD